MPSDKKLDKKREKEEKEESSDDEYDSDFSDPDYELDENELSSLTEFGISAQRAQELWNDQSGCCSISGFPLTSDGREHIYKAEVAPRRISEAISDTNSILVSRVINMMREPTNLSWSQFQSLLSKIDN